MNVEELKKSFGEEYPAAVIWEGIRLPLRHESRISRSYRSDAPNMGCEVSRFMDGSASITTSELQREWQAWTGRQRSDFCQCVAGWVS